MADLLENLGINFDLLHPLGGGGFVLELTEVGSKGETAKDRSIRE